ncbi:phosphoribosylformylglycinamidine synthase [Streptobacillus moniliformis]|uniref:Phosphoribosylformylglycinamidine synthase n=2 Tax=Streptobacillus TaxID=34104 RepID=D1AW67_STRM9|nr:phosphoribosylformylglycinamidine synthase [Streptobacillus moniliformis]ACZ00543.1 phosphoribosylformylglycinamidine synthase [Streptobacillus moniliformis DSM 12112]AVL43039.1 phosphoribosylformylglycinamidine synthase [Streptobacillus moniliformis]SQA12810.1 Phosphoribosylformylglycinamidine synthase [Streptobacillus moniliformis]
MSDLRFFVEKKKHCNFERRRLLKQLQEELGVVSLKDIRILNCYDIFGCPNDMEDIKKMILSEPVTDDIFEKLELNDEKYFAIEYLPGQFDQRAHSAMQCIDILISNKNVEITTSKIFIIYGEVSNDELQKIKNYIINPIETREKNLNILKKEKINVNTNIIQYNNFINLNSDELENLRKNLGLSMTYEDILHIQNYYKSEKRNPTETEIKVFDTYWSDHCRHSTFETKINNVKFPDSEYGKFLNLEFKKYLEIKEIVSKHKNITLMDMATVVAKYFKKIGKLDNLEISEENNACSIYIDVETEKFNGEKNIEKWLLMFKNETHNHPTEIEPFGGAATCLGGAIRDPLSGRAYVYQAIRVTGSANPLESIENTLKGKLSQKKITTGAAHGYSSYGNQIGIATSLVSEIYHEGYKAKRMEVGAVVAAAPLENVVRKTPENGDSIILLGGKTGRDGCGGATGSSKEHTNKSIFLCGSEVQKGNAPEERKIQRLFRNGNVTKLIKKCNDFGAGGVAVAIGELADGIDVNLDLIPVKYEGLSGTELAISESQERMAVVVAKEYVEEFLKEAEKENLLATVVGKITDNERLILRYRGKEIVNISRGFLNTNGATQEIDIKIENIDVKDFLSRDLSSNTFKEKWLENIEKLNVASTKGLSEMFDSSIGASTVLMPYGGKYQLSPIDVSIMKIPMISKKTNTSSAITWGYNPYLTEKSPYHGSMYAVLESIAKLVASGTSYDGIYLSFQEYFEKLGKDNVKWSKPMLALLGAMRCQLDFEIAAIGGKDSMSGTFENISVPPTLISFAVNTVNAKDVISTEIKEVGNRIYLVENKINDDLSYNSKDIKEKYSKVLDEIKKGKILSAKVVGMGGIAGTLSQMCFGNKIGIKLDNLDLDYFKYMPGSIIVESKEELDFTLIGESIKEFNITFKDEVIDLEKLLYLWLNKLDNVFPYEYKEEKKEYINISKPKIIDYSSSIKVAKPRVLITAFPGTNCEYDMKNIFERNGAITNITLFKNLNRTHIESSIDEICKELKNSQIFVIPGGFSAGDEPDGSGKFIATVLQNPKIKEEIERFLQRDGLILGICNGFQALVKSGLLPYGNIGEITEDSPTLTYNKIGRHISQMVKTRISTNRSPWLSSFNVGDEFDLPVSHGEGRFFASEKTLQKLIENGQVATQYVDFNGKATNEFKFNPNGSEFAIEGIISPDGKIFGKMGHSERTGENILKNVSGNKYQNIFKNGIEYFK